MKLSEDQLVEYSENGFLIVENLLDKKDVEVLRNRAELVATGQLTHTSKIRLQIEPMVVAG